MKCVKLNFKDILFYASNWSDQKGTSYDRFSAFLSHKIEISRKKNILGTSLGKSKTTHVAKKIQIQHTLVRIVRCRITRTTLIPLYLKNIHLPTRFFQFISLKNNVVRVKYYGASYTWIFFPAEKYTLLCQLTQLLFSTLENIFRRIYSSVRVFLDF